MNKWFATGNLTKDPELTTTANGINFCRFGLAVRRDYQQNGENETDFFNVIAWRNLAENCYKYLKKGSKIAISGTIQIRTYNSQSGEKKSITEIIADNVDFCSPKQKDANSEQSTTAFTPIDDSQLPF